MDTIRGPRHRAAPVHHHRRLRPSRSSSLAAAGVRPRRVPRRSPAPAQVPPARSPATVVPTAAPSVAGSPPPRAVFDTRTIASKFALPMKVTLPVGWKPGSDITGTLGRSYKGSPEGPESTWWGPDILLVEDAQIHDPSDVVSSEPATPDRSRFVAWPADFFAYITAVPGVTVVWPEPVTVGGVTGKQIVVKTPPMHPLVWMKGDYMWIGGEASGVDNAAERRFIVVKTGGHTVFITLADDPSTFKARDSELRAILDTISFK